MPTPVFRPSHCLQDKDKQRKARPRRAIYIHNCLIIPSIYTQISPQNGLHLIIYIKGNRRSDIEITHANASVALPLCLDSKLRSLNTQTSNVRKRPFETDPTNGLVSLSIDVIYTCPPTPERALSSAKINIIFEITNIF